MQARVKADSRHTIITAFGGHEYVQGEWRDVPAGQEEPAKRNPYLELKETGSKVVDEVASEPMVDEALETVKVPESWKKAKKS